MIEAIADGVDRIPYRADTNALTIEAGQEFTGWPAWYTSRLRALFVVDTLLARSLMAGDRSLEYSVSFHYGAAAAGVPAGGAGRARELYIRVQFHPDRLPGTVVWAVWDGLDGAIVEREPVVLDSQFAVHRYLRLAEQTAVGFHWDWSLPGDRDGTIVGVRRDEGAATTSAELRAHNLVRLLRAIHDGGGQLTRAELTRQLSLARGTATVLVRDLAGRRLIEELASPVAAAAQRARGRPTGVPSAHAQGPVALAVDLRILLCRGRVRADRPRHGT